MDNWYVFDPDPMPENGPGPKLYGPYSKIVADMKANLLHDEDGSGNTVVLQAEEPYA